MEKKSLLENLSMMVANRKSFQKIMSDDVVTDSEVKEQEALVERLIGNIEQKLSEEDFSLVTELLAELTVLQTIFQLKNTQKGE